MENNMKEVGIHYRDEEVRKLYEAANGKQRDFDTGFDLVACEDFQPYDGITGNTFTLIDLGVVIKPPEGYHVEVVSRSSLTKKTSCILGNSIGIGDRLFCGPEDYWKFGALYLPSEGVDRYGFKKGDRICQIVLRKTEYFKVVEFNPSGDSRGGIGSTGV